MGGWARNQQLLLAVNVWKIFLLNFIIQKYLLFSFNPIHFWRHRKIHIKHHGGLLHYWQGDFHRYRQRFEFCEGSKEYSKELVEKQAAKQGASVNRQTGSQPSKYQYEEDDEENDSDDEYLFIFLTTDLDFSPVFFVFINF